MSPLFRDLPIRRKLVLMTVASTAVGTVLRRADLVRGGGFALLVGFPLAMSVTAFGHGRARADR